MGVENIWLLRENKYSLLLYGLILFLRNGASILHLENGTGILYRNDGVVWYWTFFTSDVLQNLIIKRLECNTVVFENNLPPLSRTCRGCTKKAFNGIVTSDVKRHSMPNKPRSDCRKSGTYLVYAEVVKIQSCRILHDNSNQHCFWYHMTPPLCKKWSRLLLCKQSRLHAFYKTLVSYDIRKLFQYLYFVNSLWRVPLLRSAMLSTLLSF